MAYTDTDGIVDISATWATFAAASVAASNSNSQEDWDRAWDDFVSSAEAILGKAPSATHPVPHPRRRPN